MNAVTSATFYRVITNHVTVSNYTHYKAKISLVYILYILEWINFSASAMFGPEAGGTNVSVHYGFIQNLERLEFPSVEIYNFNEQIHNFTIL